MKQERIVVSFKEFKEYCTKVEESLNNVEGFYAQYKVCDLCKSGCSASFLERT